MSAPVLYTFRRCPYAMRARMALASAGLDFEVREVILRDKPAAMLALSSKGTVPVLHLAHAENKVIDESLDVMYWALNQHDPEGWLAHPSAVLDDTAELIQRCDGEFKKWLDLYKYNNRQQDYSLVEARTAAEAFLVELETSLGAASENSKAGEVGAPDAASGYLFGRVSLADIAILPFVRQFAFVDKAWFDQAPYPLLQAWLESFLASARFAQVMRKYPQWQPEQERILFSESSR